MKLTLDLLRGVALVVLVAMSAHAQGGPPLLTDDPDTPGPGYWEINVATILDHTHQVRKTDMPRVDLNYGVGRRVQLKLEMPWVGLATSGETHQHGAGDAVAGVKWRFLGQEGQHIAWSVYPQFEFNTAHSSVAKGIAEDGRRVLLPTEVTLEIFKVEINGEIGHEFAPAGQSRNVFGLSTEGHVAKRLELLAEIHRERAEGEPAETIANLGAREKFGERVILLLAAGHTVRAATEASRAIFYAGLQFNLPGLYSFQQATTPRP